MEPDRPGAKRCRDCGELKLATEFWRRKQSPDGLALYCKVCFGLRNSASYRGKRAVEGKKTRPYRRHSDVPDGMKYCPECKEIKPRSAFGSNRSQPDGLTAYCRPCHNSVTVRVKSRKHGSQRNYLLKLRYGITEQQVEELRHLQGGICVICLRRPVAHVDHDHADGAVRGLLCFGCNGGLGQFQDDPKRLRGAAGYLEGWFAHCHVNLAQATGVVQAADQEPVDEDRAMRRGYKLRKRYGIGESVVQRRIERQRGVCLVCRAAPAVHVDHDHSTGAIRGILCPPCNTGMGQFRDDPTVLRRAAEYLEKRLVRRVESVGGGTRLSFTLPDVDPSAAEADGWAMHRAADVEARRALAACVTVINVIDGVEFTYTAVYPHRRMPVTSPADPSLLERTFRGRLSRRS